MGETRLDPGGTPSAETTFTYDPVGNRLGMTVDGATMSYTYNDLDQLLTAGGTTFTYDGRGNLTGTADGSIVTTYAWDAQDRLTGVNLPDGTGLAYTYDYDGRRVRQTIDGVETTYLWDEASLHGDVVLEADGSGATLASYVLGGPIPTEPPPRKPISLGRGSWLEQFTALLNAALAAQRIRVYWYEEWTAAGLSDTNDSSRAGFGMMFDQATARAEHIHFNLEGVSTRTIDTYINKHGGQGDFIWADYFTAAELYRVRHQGLCPKTSFYTSGITPSANAWQKVCTTG